MNEFDRTLIGQRLKLRRELSGLTQEQIGEKIGKTFATVAKYESGEIKNIDIMVISTIADITGTNIDYLLLKSDNPDLTDNFKQYKHLSNSLIGRVSKKMEGMSDSELAMLDKIIDALINEKK